MKKIQLFRMLLIVTAVSGLISIDGLAQTAVSGSGQKVEAKVTVRDSKVSKQETWTEQITVPEFVLSEKVLSEPRFRAKDREQTCTEVCKEMCYGNNPQSGDWACYWTCRWYCRPAMGGDPRKKIKSISVTIDVE